ncbi:MAG: hypothetical protein QM541_02595 [Flavobacterium sp.]|nr:hypothetical protein [Flavobacterium sp.]
MSNKSIFLLFCATMLMLACSKETSFESGFGISTASGTLKDSFGNCQDISVVGNYVVDSTLDDSNYLMVTATITQGGTYKIFSDTANGYWFKDSSYILTPGTQTFKLKGYGKPILPLTSVFTIYFNTSYCSLSVIATSLPPNGGGIVTPPSGNYFPTTANSTWTYYDQTGDSITYSATSLTATIATKTYKLFVSDKKDSVLYRKDSLQGEYFSYGTFAADSRLIEYKFLDDKVALNSFWETDTLSTSTLGLPIIYKIRFTIDAKNNQYNINGNVLDSVIKVKQEILVQVSPGLFTIQPTATAYSYYAKKIGLVWLDFPNYSPAQALKIKRWNIIK